MYCKNCGKEILEDFKSCPYCQKPIKENPYSNQNEKFIPYYKRTDSLFNTHPFLAWLILIVVIILGLMFLKISIIENINFNAKYNQHTNITTTYRNY